MKVAVQGNAPVLETDGDAAFYKVNNRLAPHQLEPGVCAEAVNVRFDQGKPLPRLGVMISPWGTTHATGKVWAYARFSDPNGFDNAVLITDDQRSDGGQGKAWRICDGNTPQEISLNGHDIWATCRLVQVYNGLVLLRDGHERHYFTSGAVSSSTITLNAAPSFQNGDEVQIGGDSSAAITGSAAPNLNAPYFVRVSGSAITLYDTRAHAVAGGGTGKLSFASATGRLYVERISTQAGFYGNGAPPLILQGTDTQTPFEVGFKSVGTYVSITDTNNSTMVLTAPCHRLVPGDAVKVSGITGPSSATTYYARPLSADLLNLYTDPLYALAGGSTGLVNLTNNGETGQLNRANASGQPIAPGREGISFLQRLFIVNQRCNLLISDPNDPLHFTPMSATLSANLGENDTIIALVTMPYDTLLIIKSNNTVLSLSNLSQSSSNWVLQEVTREYGGVAALATANVGSDRWFLARRGVASITQTIQGQLQGVSKPVSDDIQQRFQSVDWLNASHSCAIEWNNRVFFALPFKGQTGTVKNNGVLVFNTLNGGWEDLWQGTLLTPVAFSRLTIGGQERLTFALPDGRVAWLTDDFQDLGSQITTRLVTRGYFKGERVLVLKGEANWDHFNVAVKISLRTAGVNESDVLLQKTYDRTQYQIANAGTYTGGSAAAFTAPHRADYAPTIAELTFAALNTFQNTTEPLRARARDRVPQLVIETTQGALQLNSVELAAKPVQTVGTAT